MIKPIIIQDISYNNQTGLYITNMQLDAMVSRICEIEGLDDVDREKDGYRHSGSKCAKIYSTCLGALDIKELLYVKAIPTILNQLASENIPYRLRPLKCEKGGKHSNKVPPKYIQLISLNIITYYLAGIFEISDELTQTYIDQCIENTPKTIVCKGGTIVTGNKPVSIEGKPLVKLLNTKVAHEHYTNCTSLSKEGDMHIDITTSMLSAYVKKSTLLREDIYIAIKALSGMHKKPMYEIIEDLILGVDYGMTLKGGGK